MPGAIVAISAMAMCRQTSILKETQPAPSHPGSNAADSQKKKPSFEHVGEDARFLGGSWGAGQERVVCWDCGKLAVSQSSSVKDSHEN